MKTTFYKKVGRKYEPVSEYDSEFCDAIPVNTAVLTVHRSGCTSRRYDIDIAHAPLIAAGLYAEDVIASAIVKAGELRMQDKDRKRQLTDSQKTAWENLVKEFGDSAKQLEWPSAREAAEAGVRAMQVEAEKLLQNPSVRAAYDHFMFLCKLTAEGKDV